MADAVEGMFKTSSFPTKQEKSPVVLINTSGDGAAGSVAVSIALVCAKKVTLSSPEDDSSIDEAPSDEGIKLISNFPISVATNIVKVWLMPT